MGFGIDILAESTNRYAVVFVFFFLLFTVRMRDKHRNVGRIKASERKKNNARVSRRRGEWGKSIKGKKAEG